MLEIDEFKVTSIEFITGTKLIAIGVLNYGLILYSIENMEVLRYIPLKS